MTDLNINRLPNVETLDPESAVFERDLKYALRWIQRHGPHGGGGSATAFDCTVDHSLSEDDPDSFKFKSFTTAFDFFPSAVRLRIFLASRSSGYNETVTYGPSTARATSLIEVYIEANRPQLGTSNMGSLNLWYQGGGGGVSWPVVTLKGVQLQAFTILHTASSPLAQLDMFDAGIGTLTLPFSSSGSTATRLTMRDGASVGSFTMPNTGKLIFNAWDSIIQSFGTIWVPTGGGAFPTLTTVRNCNITSGVTIAMVYDGFSAANGGHVDVVDNYGLGSLAVVATTGIVTPGVGAMSSLDRLSVEGNHLNGSLGVYASIGLSAIRTSYARICDNSMGSFAVQVGMLATAGLVISDNISIDAAALTINKTGAVTQTWIFEGNTLPNATLTLSSTLVGDTTPWLCTISGVYRRLTVNAAANLRLSGHVVLDLNTSSNATALTLACSHSALTAAVRNGSGTNNTPANISGDSNVVKLAGVTEFANAYVDTGTGNLIEAA